jgi:hypothetical protein
MYEKIQEDLQHLSKQIFEIKSINDDEFQNLVNEKINHFLKESFELIFKNQKTLRKKEALTLFSINNKKEEKQKTERKTRKKKNIEQKQKIPLIPLNGDLKGFYLYAGTDILMIRNGNECYAAVGNYKDENVKNLSDEDIEYCRKNNISIIDIKSYT